MGLRSALERVAARAPVPTFAVAGPARHHAVQDLRLRPELHLRDSPRAADVLLLAGPLSAELLPAVEAAHDAMSHPRATVVWGAGEAAGALAERFGSAVVVGDEVDPVGAIARTHRELLAGRRPSEAPVLPDVDPAPWRGIGPYGQGGKGMTGGVPYGRPLPERADDRDGLTLDQLPVRIGPLFAPFPAGLCLDVKLQGDVIQEVEVVDLRATAADGLDPFVRATSEPVPIVELETARARELLRWAAHALRIHGLGSLGLRVLRSAATVGPGDADLIAAVERAVRRSGLLRWAARGVGRIEPAVMAGTGAGPLARASGLIEDARLEDAAYRQIGFEPVTLEEGDAAARWRQRLAEAAQALRLAEAAGSRSAGPGPIESPRGRIEPGSPPSDLATALLPDLLVGMEWGDAVTTVLSLDPSPGRGSADLAAGAA
jgi:hypothetical protein